MSTINIWTPAQAAEAKCLYEGGMTVTNVARHMGRHVSSIRRLEARGWVALDNPQQANMRPKPDGYATIRPTLSNDAVYKRYSAGRLTVKRWDREIGYTPAPVIRKQDGPKGVSVVRWTDDEVAYLRKQIACHWTYAEISEKLPGRSRIAVSNQAFKLGLRMTERAVKRSLSESGKKAAAAKWADHTRVQPKPKRVTGWQPKAGNVARMMATDTADMARDWLVRVGKHRQVYHRIIHGKQHEGWYTVEFRWPAHRETLG